MTIARASGNRTSPGNRRSPSSQSACREHATDAGLRCGRGPCRDRRRPRRWPMSAAFEGARCRPARLGWLPLAASEIIGSYGRRMAWAMPGLQAMASMLTTAPSRLPAGGELLEQHRDGGRFRWILSCHAASRSSLTWGSARHQSARAFARRSARLTKQKEMSPCRLHPRTKSASPCLTARCGRRRAARPAPTSRPRSARALPRRRSRSRSTAR